MISFMVPNKARLDCFAFVNSKLYFINLKSFIYNHGTGPLCLWFGPKKSVFWYDLVEQASLNETLKINVIIAGENEIFCSHTLIFQKFLYISFLSIFLNKGFYLAFIKSVIKGIYVATDFYVK